MSTSTPRPSRRDLFGAAAGAAAFGSLASAHAPTILRRAGRPKMVGSANALRGMQQYFEALAGGGAPLDAAIETLKVVEADPDDSSVGLGGLPNEDGVVQLDAACMDGRTHNSGAVGAIENILHPSEVARLVMERTDHCQLFGEGAYRFARMHGHPHTELLTEASRKAWVRWKEGLSDGDDRLAPADEPKHGALPARFERHGTIHCSVLAADGEIACATSTSGLAWKIPGRCGDSPIVGAGLYCESGVGSAGATGRGEAAILACGSFAIVELLRQGKSPKDAGMEVLRRIVEHTRRLARWQPALMGENGRPAFSIQFYVLGADGRHAGVTMDREASFAVADLDGGPRHEPLERLFT